MTSSTRGAREEGGGPHKIIPMVGGALNTINFVNIVQAFSYWSFVLLNNNKTQIPVLHRLDAFVFFSSSNHLLAQPWGRVESFL